MAAFSRHFCYMAFTLPAKKERKQSVMSPTSMSETSPPLAKLPVNISVELDRLEAEFYKKLVEQKKLSTSIAPLVEQIRQEFIAAGKPDLAASLMQGNYCDKRLGDLRNKINALQRELTALYDQIEHVKKYGELPAQLETGPVLKQTDSTIATLRYEIRRLDDLIYKTQKKLDEKPNSKTERQLLWKEKLALAEAQRDELKHQLKVKEYEGRSRVNAA